MYRAEKNEKDVKYILDNLRPEDLHEVQAVYGADYKKKVFQNIMKTNFYVLLGKSKNKDIPIVMGGIWPPFAQPDAGINNIGVCWLMSTDKVKNHIKCLLKELKKEIEKADEKYSITYNFIWKENTLMKKWLKKCGYKFDNQAAADAALQHSLPKPENMNVPEGFEFFYRIRQVKGLGE